MTLWIDAQLSPAIASWITEDFPVIATALRDLGLRDATDPVIFNAAKNADVIVMTKDADFPQLLERFGPPPKIIIAITFPDRDTEKKALGFLLGRFSGRVLQSGEHLVPEAALEALVDQNISFSISNKQYKKH